MPTYTATTDIYDVLAEKLVAELTDDAAGASVDTDIVDSALDRAESLVDSYVGKVYSVPLTLPVLDSIKHAVLTLAKCSLYRRRPKAIPQEAIDACETVTKWLEDIASGAVVLPALTVAENIAEQSNDDEVFDSQVFGR